MCLLYQLGEGGKSFHLGYFPHKSQEEDDFGIQLASDLSTKNLNHFLTQRYCEIIHIQVRQRQSEGLSWSSAMNEVRVQRLIQKYKDNGELESEDPALVMLKTWPTSKRYKDNPDKLLGLEQLVCRLCKLLNFFVCKIQIYQLETCRTQHTRRVH